MSSAPASTPSVAPAAAPSASTTPAAAPAVKGWMDRFGAAISGTLKGAAEVAKDQKVQIGAGIAGLASIAAVGYGVKKAYEAVVTLVPRGVESLGHAIGTTIDLAEKGVEHGSNSLVEKPDYEPVKGWTAPLNAGTNLVKGVLAEPVRGFGALFHGIKGAAFGAVKGIAEGTVRFFNPNSKWEMPTPKSLQGSAHAEAHHAHEAHGHEAHGHDAHGHETHAEEAHGHDEHGHAEHGEEAHGHDEHGHAEHAEEAHAHDKDGHKKEEAHPAPDAHHRRKAA